ncbi:phage tail tape measure protein [Enterobacter quasiroggenkampii]|uniref:phage tail tape measure protein n=1 Tax=Enterobacter quasiroggenkampii TaxID=2497436 RepID=UPI003D9BF43C
MWRVLRPRSRYNANDVLAATGSTVNLSLAADVDIAEAADIITNMQSAFNLPTTEIERVADVMTKGFTSSNTGLVELGEAMKYVAPIAEAAGASIEDTTAMLGILADNLDGDLKNLQSAWEDLQIEVFEKEDSALRRLTVSATDWLGRVAAWAKANPELTQTLFNLVAGGLELVGVLRGIGLIGWPVIAGINGIIAAAGLLSVVFTIAGSAIVAAVSAISLPVVAVVAAVVAGALLIRKYWEPISAFFSGMVEGLKAAFAPVAEIFAPLAPVFDSFMEKLRGVWQRFKDLIAPVKSTQETLDSCKNAGVMFGKALADALMLPFKSFNTLRTGVSWLLEKLGVIKKESGELDQTAAKASAATGSQKGSYIPATSAYGGYQVYQPVTAPTGKTYVDQSKPEYNINLNGGIAPGSDLDRQLREAVDKLDRENRARQRSSMRHD